MMTKKEDLECSKRLYSEYLKGRKNPKTEDRFEAAFDFGYERGLWAAWCILQENRDSMIEKEKKNSGFFGKYHASSSVHRLMDLVSDYKITHKCSEKYARISSFCECCGKLK